MASALNVLLLAPFPHLMHLKSPPKSLHNSFSFAQSHTCFSFRSTSSPCIHFFSQLFTRSSVNCSLHLLPDHQPSHSCPCMKICCSAVMALSFSVRCALTWILSTSQFFSEHTLSLIPKSSPNENLHFLSGLYEHFAQGVLQHNSKKQAAPLRTNTTPEDQPTAD